MNSSFAALCTDFYVNQKISLKMDLPSNRETILHMMDRVRKEIPAMSRFRRFDDEVALESPDDEHNYCWLALRRTSIRSGWVNPVSLDRAYDLHRLIIEVAPYFLSISPIDVEHVELVYGFDLEAGDERNEIVFDALLSQSQFASVIDTERETMLDVQPFLAFSLSTKGDLQAFLEVKTRPDQMEITSNGRLNESPISVYLTARRHGPFQAMDELNTTFGMLAGHLERLAEERVIPNVVVPLREAILSRP